MELTVMSNGFKETLDSILSTCLTQVKLQEFLNYQLRDLRTYCSTIVEFRLIRLCRGQIGGLGHYLMKCSNMQERTLIIYSTFTTASVNSSKKRVQNTTQKILCSSSKMFYIDRLHFVLRSMKSLKQRVLITSEPSQIAVTSLVSTDCVFLR